MSRKDERIIFTKDEGPSKTVRNRPTQGDWVLIREMDPNQPDTTQESREHALNYDPDAEEGDRPLYSIVEGEVERIQGTSHSVSSGKYITPGPDGKEESGIAKDAQSSKTLVDFGRPRFVPSGSAHDDPHWSERPRRRRNAMSYHSRAPRTTSGPRYPSGAAVIQPATMQRERSPSITTRPMSYSEELEPQYYQTPGHPVTFQCTLCKKRFARAYGLRSHLRKHIDGRSGSPRSVDRASAINSSLQSDSQDERANDPDLDVSKRDLESSYSTPEHDNGIVSPENEGDRHSIMPNQKLAGFSNLPDSSSSVQQTVSSQHQQATTNLEAHSQAQTASELCVNVDTLENTAMIADITATAKSESPLKLSVHDYGIVDTWLDTGIAGDNGTNLEWDYNDIQSGPSSYAASVASVFSVASLASSASDMSRGSGYSAVQIAAATKVLLAIFYEDENLLLLYNTAIENQNIGLGRLQRNLRRLFRAYAGLLEGEATERLEYLASRLVLIKSAMLAQSIVEKLQSGRTGLPLPRRERNEESSDEEDNNADTRPVNEDAFEDLAIFREFLVESEAFKTFRVQLQAFIVPKLIHLTHLESARSGDIANAATTEAIAGQKMTSTWQNWRNDSEKSTGGFLGGAHGKMTASSVLLRMTDAFMSATDDVMIAAGLLEPPLRPDTVRLRWQCACGESLHSDVAELRRGGIDELVDHMRRTSGAKVRVSAHSHQSGNQQYIAPHPIQWIRKAVTSIFSGSTRRSSSCLPQHNTPCTATSTTNTPQPQQSLLHLLACMHRNRLRKVLKQERIDDVTTDRTLLCFMRKQYLRHRGRFLHMLSLKTVKGIYFVKFRLPIGGSVDVRHHDPCCVTNSTGQVACECIPPPLKVEPSPGAEYRCIPGPPATYPPIPPVYLASLFTCPTDVHEKDTWILDQLPKRTCGELRGQIGQPAEGWGIYYDEGLDRDTLALTVLVVFLIASLLFGILWSRFQYDIQGAFGVSAYMVACCAALLPVIVTRLENKG